MAIQPIDFGNPDSVLHINQRLSEGLIRPESLVVASDGRTYFRKDLEEASQEECRHASLSFLTQDGKSLSLLEVRACFSEEHPSSRLIFNQGLAESLRLKKPARCRLSGSTLLVPVLLPDGSSHEQYALAKYLKYAVVDGKVVYDPERHTFVFKNLGETIQFVFDDLKANDSLSSYIVYYYAHHDKKELAHFFEKNPIKELKSVALQQIEITRLELEKSIKRAKRDKNCLKFQYCFLGAPLHDPDLGDISRLVCVVYSMGGFFSFLTSLGFILFIRAIKSEKKEDMSLYTIAVALLGCSLIVTAGCFLFAKYMRSRNRGLNGASTEARIAQLESGIKMDQWAKPCLEKLALFETQGYEAALNKLAFIASTWNDPKAVVEIKQQTMLLDAPNENTPLFSARQ